MAKPKPSSAPIASQIADSGMPVSNEKDHGNFVERMQTDVRGRFHIWIESTDKDNLASTDDLYAAARETIGDFDRREWDLSAETLHPGRFHLVEKGFISWPSTS